MMWRMLILGFDPRNLSLLTACWARESLLGTKRVLYQLSYTSCCGFHLQKTIFEGFIKGSPSLVTPHEEEEERVRRAGPRVRPPEGVSCIKKKA